MANANTPFGLRPLAYSSGGPYNGAVQVYYVPSGNATALFLGDPLLVLDDSADANGVPAIGIATAGGTTNYITGAMMGIANNAGELVIPVTQSTLVYLPASTAAYIYVADDPNLVFELQEDSVGGALAAGAASRNASLVAGSGSTVTAMSGWMLDSSTLGTTSTLQMRLLRAYQSMDNAIGDYAKWLCRINMHSITNPSGV